MATTNNHSFTKHTQASGSAAVNVLSSLISDLDGLVAASGRASFDGAAEVTTFNISHGLDYNPTNAQVTAATSDAAGDFYVSGVDGTNITVEYASAPAAGTGNVTLMWAAYP